MLRVALTGGIATGKSYVLKQLEARGAPVIDADRLAHDVIRRGSPAWALLKARFGEAVLGEAGEIDRVRLGSIVFSDEAARRALEEIVHPEVYRRIAAWFTELTAQGVAGPVVADIPLLFETGHERDFDRIIVTACEPAEQRRRLLARGLSEDDADRRLAAQWPLDRKIERADYVIRTDGLFEDTDRQVENVWTGLRQMR